MPIPASSKPKIARRLLRDEAHDAIRDAILDGTLAAGEQLDDASLQEWLGISRTPIREAIIALQVEGLVEIAAQTHTRVVQPSRESVEDAIQTVGVVLGGVMRTVIPALSNDSRSTMLAFTDRAQAAIDANDVRGHMAVAVELYDFLVQQCPNPTLQRLAAGTVTSLSFQYRITIDSRTPNWELLSSGWRRMREGIEAADPIATELAFEDMHRLPLPGPAWAPATWHEPAES